MIKKLIRQARLFGNQFHNIKNQPGLWQTCVCPYMLCISTPRMRTGAAAGEATSYTTKQTENENSGYDDISEALLL